MKKIILFLYIFTIMAFPFVELQYKSTPKETFEFFGSIASMGIAQTGQQVPSISFYGVNYRFDNIGYGFNIYPVQLSAGDSFAWTSHNLYAQIYEGFPVLWLKATLQIGIVNLGLPQTSLQSSTFTDYLQSYYITHKVRLNNHFNFYISSGPRGDGQAFYHRSLIEYIYNGNRGFLEYSPNKNQIYVGGEVAINRDITFTIGTNITGTIPDINGDYFYPTSVFGLRISNPFFRKKEKPKPVPPVDIDIEAYILMEKGLLSYYESDYKKALQEYLSVLKKYPTFALAHIRAGNCFFKLNQFSQAKKHWQTALVLDPNNVDVLEALSKIQNNSIQRASLIND